MKTYHEQWNADEQARIDEDIERNRKADASLALGPGAAGRPVKVEQISHAFQFGAHLFNFDQLGSDARNERHKAMWKKGGLFNRATVPFYWEPFEPEEGRMRFAPGPEDAASFWNGLKDPEWHRFWRRPPTDPVVAFCEENGIRMHGHVLVWSNTGWHVPRWLAAKLPRDILAQFVTDTRNGTNVQNRPPEELAQRLPDFVAAFNEALERRFREIFAHYGDRIKSWDVCNESAVDYEAGRLVPGSALCHSCGFLQPGDYCHLAFRLAERFIPAGVERHINDYHLKPAYAAQVQDMLARGDRIDMMGLQMHMFDPAQMPRLRAGEINGSGGLMMPESFRKTMDTLSAPGLPFHLSEITITSGDDSPAARDFQAEAARNFYRICFSHPKMTAITWWNTVDGCGAPGEPSVSGLCDRDVRPKPAYHALDDLINHQWRTNLTVEAGAGGAVAFRGFRGRYRLSWTDDANRPCEQTFDLA